MGNEDTAAAAPAGTSAEQHVTMEQEAQADRAREAQRYELQRDEFVSFFRNAGGKRIGFLASSRRVGVPKFFAIPPGFEQLGAREKLRAELAKGGDWRGFVAVERPDDGDVILVPFREDVETELDKPQG